MNSTVRGAIKSKTNWLGIAVVVLGYLQMPENMKVISEYVPAQIVPLLNMAIGLGVMVARFTTTESLSEKGKE